MREKKNNGEERNIQQVKRNGHNETLRKVISASTSLELSGHCNMLCFTFNKSIIVLQYMKSSTDKACFQLSYSKVEITLESFIRTLTSLLRLSRIKRKLQATLEELVLEAATRAHIDNTSLSDKKHFPIILKILIKTKCANQGD